MSNPNSDDNYDEDEEEDYENDDFEGTIDSINLAQAGVKPDDATVNVGKNSSIDTKRMSQQHKTAGGTSQRSYQNHTALQS